MFSLCRFLRPSVNILQLQTLSSRCINLSVVDRLKEIRETKTPKELIIEGVYVKSPREDLLVRVEPQPVVAESGEEKTPCYMCALDLDLKYTDVLILSQFLKTDGRMLPRRTTGLCSMQQKRVGKMVQMAQKAGLMLNFAPEGCRRDIRRRVEHKKYNSYYDETTIFAKKKLTWLQKWKKDR